MPKQDKGVDTDEERHRAGGPGKAARSGHLEDGKTGNKEGQVQPDRAVDSSRDGRRHDAGYNSSPSRKS